MIFVYLVIQAKSVHWLTRVSLSDIQVLYALSIGLILTSVEAMIIFTWDNALSGQIIVLEQDCAVLVHEDAFLCKKLGINIVLWGCEGIGFGVETTVVCVGVGDLVGWIVILGVFEIIKDG